ncbi:hypothetical protein EDC04DRAFT_2902833 [Pisolithus marmoratus]|nr:hypothetical protein EDC04DRAFT_2902833 [Pisolithus marmoratus]
MKSEIVIQVRLQPRSAAVNLLSQQIPQGEPRGSNLLRSIRAALNGSAPDGVATTYAPCFTDGSDSWVEQELSWNNRCVILSHGGVIRRKWDFVEEEQSIQYACLGRFAHSTEATGPVHGSAHYTTSKEEYTHTGPAGDALFGPFHAINEDKLKNELAQEVVPAVFVFLRSIGKVFLSTGVDYTFSLPFLVRKAWPLYPHGVLIQRVLEPAEIEEARFTGDTLLPTIFSITNAFAEPAAIGITAGIVGGRGDTPISLSDEDEQCSKPLAAVSASEEVVWVSTHNSNIDVLITFNEEIRQLVVWRYTYVKPKGIFDPIEHGRTKASFWVQRLATRPLTKLPGRWMEGFSAALFDQRHDGSEFRTLLTICIPGTQALVYALPVDEAGQCLHANYLTTIDATSVTPIRSTRAETWDLLVVRSGGTVSILTHGLHDLPIQLCLSTSRSVQTQGAGQLSGVEVNNIVAAKWECISSVTLICSGGESYRGRFDMLPQDPLVYQALRVLALVLPKQEAFDVHRKFLEAWTPHYFWTSSNMEFHALSVAISFVLQLKPVYPLKDDKPPSTPWDKFCHLAADSRSFTDDPALQRLKLPVSPISRQYFLFTLQPNPLLAPVLYALHMLAEDLRLAVHRHDSLLLLVPLVCQIAHITRPEWVDYWKRLCPNIMPAWPSPSTVRADTLDDRIPVWPPDMTAVLYGRLSNPDWKFLPYESTRLASLFDIQPSFAFGDAEPLLTLQRVTTAYLCLAGDSVASTQRRAQLTVETLIQTWGTAKKGLRFLDSLPLGIAAPLREAIRTCQLSPPGNWRSEHYKLVGRQDLAFSVAEVQPVHFQQGLYQSPETYMNSHHRVTISNLVDQAKSASNGEIDVVSASARLVERPDLNEHDQAKEQQHQVVRLAERTLALPYGRAMFTFGTVQTVTREAYVIPKMEFSVRIQPSNVIATPEPGKIPLECTNWGEFHNGVAAGLRIGPGARGVESSWIAFNKPSELTPQHAGFLFGLGLIGHLKEMLTWHTFGYLTPNMISRPLAFCLALRR